VPPPAPVPRDGDQIREAANSTRVTLAPTFQRAAAVWFPSPDPVCPLSFTMRS